MLLDESFISTENDFSETSISSEKDFGSSTCSFVTDFIDTTIEAILPDNAFSWITHDNILITDHDLNTITLD